MHSMNVLHDFKFSYYFLMSVIGDTLTLKTILELLPSSPPPLAVSLSCSPQLGWRGWNTYSHSAQLVGQKVRHSARPPVTPPSEVRIESKIEDQRESITPLASLLPLSRIRHPCIQILNLSSHSVGPEIQCVSLSALALLPVPDRYYLVCLQMFPFFAKFLERVVCIHSL